MGKKLKIAFLNMYSGWVDRGAETFISEVAQRLSEKNEVTVFQGGSAKKIGDYLVEFIDVGIDWIHKDTTLTLPRLFFLDYWSRKIFWFTLKILPRLWKEKFDIVIPLNGGWQPALVRLITWLYGGKMVISGQSGMGWDDINNLWNFPNAFIGLSSTAKNWAKSINPLIRIEYIPNGVDSKKFGSSDEKIEVPLGKPIVLFVGALEPGKRPIETIKAVSVAKNMSLLMVGDGDLRDSVKNLGKKLLGSRFKLMKFPYGLMPQVYRTADVFTIPSKSHYAFEIVLLEAMATNLPVVANDDPIRQEIVGEAGILVDPTNTQNYAEALRKALNTNWGKRPRNNAERFSWEKIAEQYEELFKKL